MSTGQPIPFFPHAPAQYDQRYFSQVVRAFAVYAEQMRNSQLNNDFLSSANNLSDLTNAATARANLEIYYRGLRATYGGTADAVTLTTGAGLSGTPPTGLALRFRATAANTGATTIALDGGTPIACRTVTGVALPGGYIRTDADTDAVFDGTFWVLRRTPEYGSNANGNFMRLENSWMHVNKRLTGLGPISTAAGTLFALSTPESVGTLAAEFIAQPTRQICAGSPTLSAQTGGIAAPTVSDGGTFQLFRVASTANTNFFADCDFYGRWY